MPLFEYRCKKCDHVTTFLEKADTQGVHACEDCGSKQTEKVLSTFAPAVAGGGSASSGASCPTGSCPTGTCPFA